jgi:uncharacterized linocin/CFP29 family protein
MSDDLNRSLAPITVAGWAAIEAEAQGTLTAWLAARKLVDFTGPVGWQVSSVNLGRTAPIDLGPGAVTGQLRQLLPMVELRVPFSLSREELATVDRGNSSPDLAPLVKAARVMAGAEDRLVFDGHGDAGIWGVGGGGGNDTVQLGQSAEDLLAGFADAVGQLRRRGVEGPYAAAVGPDLHDRLQGAATGGRSALEMVRRTLGGPVIWAPTLGATALVLSRRGGDFEMTVGRDLSIGYQHHSATKVMLYLEQSLTFRALDPDAAVRLVSV